MGATAGDGRPVGGLTRVLVHVLVGVLAVVLAGCTTAPAPVRTGPTTASTAPPPSAAGQSTTDAAPAPRPALPPTAAEVRATGSAVEVGGHTVHVLGAVDPGEPDDGALTLVLRGPATSAPSSVPPPPAGPPADRRAEPPTSTSTDAAAGLVRVAGPPGTRAEVLVDGTAVLREAGGSVVVGVVAEGARLAADHALLEVTPASDRARVVVGGAPLVSATWADRGDEGGLSLVLVPRPWVRTAGAAGVEAVWSALGSHPDLGGDATAPGMRDQLECHALGAPDKDSWNLEPWRPDVGLLATLAARCNP